jgi:hypothetical protein
MAFTDEDDELPDIPLWATMSGDSWRLWLLGVAKAKAADGQLDGALARARGNLEEAIVSIDPTFFSSKSDPWPPLPASKTPWGSLFP